MGAASPFTVIVAQTTSHSEGSVPPFVRHMKWSLQWYGYLSLDVSRAGSIWQSVAQVTGYAGLSGLVGEVMLYTGPEQHCANRGALLIPKGGVLQTSPGRFSGHSEKALLETSLKVGLPVQWLAAIDACAGGGSVDCQGEENHDSGNF